MLEHPPNVEVPAALRRQAELQSLEGVLDTEEVPVVIQWARSVQQCLSPGAGTGRAGCRGGSPLQDQWCPWLRTGWVAASRDGRTSPCSAAPRLRFRAWLPCTIGPHRKKKSDSRTSRMSSVPFAGTLGIMGYLSLRSWSGSFSSYILTNCS